MANNGPNASDAAKRGHFPCAPPMARLRAVGPPSAAHGTMTSATTARATKTIAVESRPADRTRGSSSARAVAGVANRSPRISAGGVGRAFALFWQCEEFLVPFRQEARALGGGTVFGEIVVDELDLAEFLRLRRRARILVRRHLVRDLVLCTDALCLGGQRPVVPLLGVFHVLGAFDDAHAADLVAGALARRHDFERSSTNRLHDRVMLKGDADQRLARRRCARWRSARLGVLVDVLV